MTKNKVKKISLKKENKEWNAIKKMEIAQDKYRQKIGEVEWDRMQKLENKWRNDEAAHHIENLLAILNKKPNNKNVIHGLKMLGYPIAD